MRPPEGPPCRPRPTSYTDSVPPGLVWEQPEAPPVGQAVIYVDGWNLYHGIKSRYGRTYLWLDLYGLATRMRQPDSILMVRYFTTIVAGEPDAARNQETYLAALTSYRPAVAVVRGRFKRKQ